MALEAFRVMVRIPVAAEKTISPATMAPLGVAASTSSAVAKFCDTVTVADVRLALSASVTVMAGATATAAEPSVKTSGVAGTPATTGAAVAEVSPKMRTLSTQRYSLVALLCITTRTCTLVPVGIG